MKVLLQLSKFFPLSLLSSLLSLRQNEGTRKNGWNEGKIQGGRGLRGMREKNKEGREIRKMEKKDQEIKREGGRKRLLEGKVE